MKSLRCEHLVVTGIQTPSQQRIISVFRYSPGDEPRKFYDRLTHLVES